MRLLILGVVLYGGYRGFQLYRSIYRPNVEIAEGEDAFLYVRSGASYDDVLKTLTDGGWLSDPESFSFVARLKKYPDRIRPGRYRLREGMSNEALVNMLRSGEQEALRISINHIHVPEELAGLLGRNLESDSVAFLEVLRSNSGLKEQGIGWDQSFFICLPNTYDFYWNTTPEKFVELMAGHYRKFWTEERIARAEAMGMSVKEVTTLASIVEMESWKRDERPRVAGVYINRLRIGMRLQADPTLIFAHGDFSVRRVTGALMQIDSPYNTYKYAGLPPGPIGLPSASAIESVLHFETHKYLYFCARADLSGYHDFAENFTQHRINAQKYQRALNNRGIR